MFSVLHSKRKRDSADDDDATSGVPPAKSLKPDPESANPASLRSVRICIMDTAIMRLSDFMLNTVQQSMDAIRRAQALALLCMWWHQLQDSELPEEEIRKQMRKAPGGTVHCHTMEGKTMKIQVDTYSITVMDLKLVLEAHTGVRAADQIMVEMFPLEDNILLSDYGFHADANLFVKMRPRDGAVVLPIPEVEAHYKQEHGEPMVVNIRKQGDLTWRKIKVDAHTRLDMLLRNVIRKLIGEDRTEYQLRHKDRMVDVHESMCGNLLRAGAKLEVVV